MSKLIILVGLPGSGKTTYGKSLVKLFPDSTVMYSSDSIREELYGDESIQGDADKVFTLLRQRTIQALHRGKTVVYDATNVTRKNRKNIIQAVKANCLVHDYTIEAHVIWAPWEQCVERDAARKRSVGKDVIMKFLRRWQTPYYDEGIDDIVVKFNCDVGWDRMDYVFGLKEAMDIDQENPHHTLKVLEHCEKAAQLAYDKDYDVVVTDAAKWHDVGKPLTKFFKKDEAGNIIPHAHYYDHHCVGGYLVLGMYEGIMLSGLQVSYLITYHMDPFFNTKYWQFDMPENMKTMIDQLHECDLLAH